MINKNDIIPIIVLTVVVCASVITLALTDDVTRDRIEQQKLIEIQSSLSTQFPDMTDFVYNDDVDVYIVYSGDVTDSQNIIGYSFESSGSGYGGTIDILVSLKDLDTINGISIINHMETPGLGAKIVEQSFTDQFKDVLIQDVKLRKDDGQIDAISGATISSLAVVKAVSETALEKVALLKEKDNV